MNQAKKRGNKFRARQNFLQNWFFSEEKKKWLKKADKNDEIENILTNVIKFNWSYLLLVLD